MEPSNSDKEYASMLEKPLFFDKPTEVVCRKSRVRTFCYNFVVPSAVAIAIFLLILYTPATAKLLQVKHPKESCKLTTDRLGFLPSADELEYSDYFPQDEKAWKVSPFSGYPTEKKGQAWDHLQLRGSRVSKHEGAKIGLPDGLVVDEHSQATILGVMHNLHCLRMVRQYLYPEYYYPKLSELELEIMRNHSDHCIETLRESIMCLPDLTPHALEWADKDERIHVNLNPVVKRQCVDWSSLVQWERQREYHLDDLWKANPPQ